MVKCKSKMASSFIPLNYGKNIAFISKDGLIFAKKY
jgi:hypothetical protein